MAEGEKEKKEREIIFLDALATSKHMTQVVKHLLILSFLLSFLYLGLHDIGLMEQLASRLLCHS